MIQQFPSYNDWAFAQQFYIQSEHPFFLCVPIERVQSYCMHMTGPHLLFIEMHKSYGYKRLSKRGNGAVSLTCSTPEIQATVLSKPKPNPLCGTEP